MSNNYFCSFADTTLKVSLDRIGKQVKKTKLFKKIFLYTEKNLPLYAKERCTKIIEKTGTRRGYGYWSWKPAIILDVLSKVSEGDIIFYSDAGSHINYKGNVKLIEYFDKAKQYDIWVNSLPDNNFNEYFYSKADLLNYFSKLNIDTNLFNTGQIQSTNIILVKNNYTLKLMNLFNTLMSLDNLHYFDDSPSIIENDKRFIENRHDQSVFSLLLKSNHFYNEKNAKTWAPDENGWKELEKSEPILNKRDKVYGQYYSFRDRLSIFFHKIKKMFTLE